MRIRIQAELKTSALEYGNIEGLEIIKHVKKLIKLPTIIIWGEFFPLFKKIKEKKWWNNSGWYEELARRLALNGFVVFGHDHRGHGRSEGKRAYIEK